MKLLRAWQRRRLADKCAQAAHHYAMILLARIMQNAEAGMERTTATEEEIRQLEFWQRATIRYSRLAVGQNPWRDIREPRIPPAPPRPPRRPPF